jgi:hypothetical protein
MALLEQRVGSIEIAKRQPTNPFIKATQKHRYGILLFFTALLHPFGERQSQPVLSADKMMCPLAGDRNEVTCLSDQLAEDTCARPSFAYLW